MPVVTLTTPEIPLKAKTRYQALDALRGVAALAVVVYHLNEVKISSSLLPGAYLAVDFFFVLSGFVVALAYEKALQSRMTWGSFFIKRMIRLFPLALLGAILGLLVLLLKWHTLPTKVDPLGFILLSGLLNCMLLPMLFGGKPSRHDLFPGDAPLWTIFLEVLINLLWARIGVFLKTWTLATFALLSGACLAVIATHFHTANIGFDVATFWGGMARVCFGFPLGVVIYRLHLKIKIPATAVGTVILGIALLAIFALPWNVAAAGVPCRDLISIFILFPTIVVLGAGQGTGGHIGAVVGALSYPIYALHFPVLLIASGLHQTRFAAENTAAIAVCTLVVVLILGAAALRFYDEPFRRFLSRRPNRGVHAAWPP